jgi:hypothetical protein
VHRSFQQRCREEVLRKVLTDLATRFAKKARSTSRSALSTPPSLRRKAQARRLDRPDAEKGGKIMAIVDRHGLLLSVSTYAANHHEVTLVQLSFEFYMIEAKPEELIGDRAYDSDQLDEQLRREGVEMIAPHRNNRRRKTRMVDDCGAMTGAGSLSDSSRASNAVVAYSCDGSSIHATSWASCSSQPSGTSLCVHQRLTPARRRGRLLALHRLGGFDLIVRSTLPRVIVEN